MSESAAERAHIIKFSERLFHAMEVAALMSLKANAKLVAATKTRAELAHEAALRVSGYPPKMVPNPRRFEPRPDFQEICDAAMVQAMAAAQLVIDDDNKREALSR